MRKTKFPPPPIDADDPSFCVQYSEELHGEKLHAEVDVSHLPPKHATALLDIIKRYWCIFDERGTFTPVKSYQCIIDTGNATPIAIKKILYGQADRACGTEISKVVCYFFVLLVLIPYAGYRVTGYRVTLTDVTPPQAATKIMTGMAEWQKE